MSGSFPGLRQKNLEPPFRFDFTRELTFNGVENNRTKGHVKKNLMEMTSANETHKAKPFALD